MKVTDTMVLFWGGVLSQWHPCTIQIAGIIYNCAEQYMMAMKAQYFGDEVTLAKIMATNEPRKQKAFGRLVKNFNEEAWKQVAMEFVYRANLVKFQDVQLKRFLKDTGSKEIVEASPYDRVWGIGLSEDDPRALDKSQWQGTNWLGKVLMQVRRDLFAQ